MERLHVRLVVVTMVKSLVPIVAGCGGSNRGPTAPSGPTDAIPGAIKNFKIDGNVLLTAIGQTSPLVAMATFADGTMKDVTGDTTWRSLDPSVVKCSSVGLLTAVRFGVVKIMASYRGQVQQVHVRVAPPNTSVFQVAGIQEGALDDNGDETKLCPFVPQDADGGFTLSTGAGYTLVVDSSEPAPGHCITYNVAYSWGFPASSPAPCFTQIIRGWVSFLTPDASNPQSFQEQRLTLLAEDRDSKSSTTTTNTVNLPIRFRP